MLVVMVREEKVEIGGIVMCCIGEVSEFCEFGNIIGLFRGIY